MSEDDLLLKTGKMIKEGRELKERLGGLRNELNHFAASWKKLGSECSGSSTWSYRVGKDSLEVLNPSQSLAVIATIPWKHLDAEAAKRLFGDIQTTGEALAEIEGQLRAFGVSLTPL